MEIRISLTVEDFRSLVRGGIVEKKIPGLNEIKIALQDIGYLQMLEEVSQAVDLWDYVDRGE
jgi:hypothetical protein